MFVDQLFGEAIIRLRGDRSQRLVAKRSGIAPGTLSGWERGRRLPRKSQISRLLKGLDCTEEDIVATMWRIQGERLVMVGSEAGDKTLAALAEHNEKITALLRANIEKLPKSAQPILVRLQANIRETGEKLIAANSDLSALIVALGTSRK